MSISLAAPGLLERFVAAARYPPAEPYRNLAPFRFADAPLLVARDGEVERLVRLVTMYRGVLLYGESGAGKSSVVNAGVLPRLTEDGFWPHRVRVQPVTGQEFALEPIPCSDDKEKDAFLPSAFEGASSDGRLVLGADAFAAAVRDTTQHGSTLLVFDQFEYLVTLFPRARVFDETQSRDPENDHRPPPRRDPAGEVAVRVPGGLPGRAEPPARGAAGTGRPEPAARGPATGLRTGDHPGAV